MSDILTNLNKILSSIYGKDVRQAIHDAIHDCYEDGRAGAIDLVAREKFADLNAGSSISFEKAQINTLRNTICGDANHYLQGGCYVHSLDHFVLAFSPVAGSGTNTTILVELDTDFSTVINTVESVDFGHCNDLTYNINTDRIYASSTGHESASAYIGKVVVIDPATLAVESTVNEITNIVSAISYDPDNDLYYTVELLANQDNHRVVYKYDSEFNFIESLGDAYIINPTRQVGQCSFVENGEFYYVTESNYMGHHVWINTFGENAKVWQHENFAYYESESVVQYNNKLYLFAIKELTYIYIYELGGKNEIYNYTEELYQRGTILKKNEDLNNITETGRYYETQASAGTITNVPYAMTDEFTLDVLHLGYNNILQVVTTTNREVFIRRYNDGWSVWMSLRSGFKFREQTVSIESFYGVGLATEGGKEFRFSIPMEIESSVGNVSVTSGSARVIQNGSVLIATGAMSSIFSEVTVTKNDVGLVFVCKVATAPSGVTNNDLCLVQLYSVKLLFSA